MTPEDVTALVVPAGLRLSRIVELPPYHYAILFEKPTAAARRYFGAKDHSAPSVFRPENLLHSRHRGREHTRWGRYQS
jgi:hypothetical protein